jgi:signal transduction histidine kinase
MRLHPLAMTGNTPISWRQTLAWWLPFGIRWIIASGVALSVTLLWLLVALHPTQSDAELIAFYLAISSLVGIVLGSIAQRWMLASYRKILWLKLSLPAGLGAIMIAMNVIIVARLMFISEQDSQLVLAFLAFGMLIALMLSLSLANMMSRSLHQVINGAQRVASGDYHARIHTDGLSAISEMQHLANVFNQMSESIADAFEQRQHAEQSRRDIIAALSHDVRTPLASVRAMLEAIDDGMVTDPAMVHRYHTAMRVEIGHLSVLLDDLFEMSRIEAGALRLNRSSMNIGDVISDILAATHEEAERAGIKLLGHIDTQVPNVSADMRQIYRVLTNLTRNALHHTPNGGRIQICAMVTPEQPEQLTVQVCDTGAGIAPADLPHIFRMAYRGEASRRRTAPPEQSGAGLGLAIARGLVEAHGGRIGACSPLPDSIRAQLAVTANDGPGTLIWFTLPRQSINERGIS